MNVATTAVALFGLLPMLFAQELGNAWGTASA